MTPPPASLPFVSVIVPTHGRPVLLARLLDSLLGQTYPAARFEVLVMHNHTPDATEAVVRRAAAAAAGLPGPGIRYHRTDFASPGPSRQRGAEHARGTVLAFIDDDCAATPGWLRAGVAAMAGGHALVQGRTLPDPAQPRRLLEKTVTVTAATPFFETCNIFYDAAAFHAVGGFPPAFRERFYAEDTALGWAVVGSGRSAGFAPDALVHHEVFAVGPWRWLMEVRNMRHWPVLVRAYPALRRRLFLGLFLSRLTAAFDLFALGMAGGVLLHPALAVLGLPYLALRFGDPGRLRRPHLLVARFLAGLPRAAVLAGTLLAASVRARSVVL